MTFENITDYSHILLKISQLKMLCQFLLVHSNFCYTVNKNYWSELILSYYDANLKYLKL